MRGRGVLSLLLALALVLGGCAHSEQSRAEHLAQRCAAAAEYAAEGKVDVPRETETLHYTLSVRGGEEETRVCVREPEELADVTAVLRGDSLALEYDGMLLDAGSVLPQVTALNAVPLLLRAAAEGDVREESEERFAEQTATRICFETRVDGKSVRCTAFFGADDAPLYAEFAHDEKIILFLEFTSFAFGDIIT